jgi:REP element-mobilizing transposase RayT
VCDRNNIMLSSVCFEGRNSKCFPNNLHVHFFIAKSIYSSPSSIIQYIFKTQALPWFRGTVKMSLGSTLWTQIFVNSSFNEVTQNSMNKIDVKVA